MYCDYIIENESYGEVLPKIVKAFEGAIPRAKRVSENELNLTLHLYQSTIRGICRNMSLIFIVEKK
jgi:hypothetical protein